MFNIILSLSLLMIGTSVQANDIKLNEELLVDLVKKGEAPSIQQIESSLIQAQNRVLQFNDSFKVKGFTQGSYKKTDEESLLAAQPVFTPTSSFAIGAQKSLAYGVQLKTSVGASKNDYVYGGVPTTGTISNVAVSANVDLWKNLFGRLTKANSETLDLSYKSAKLQKSVQTQIFLNNVRSLYWQLVSNQESMKISNDLLNSAIKQEKEAVKRLRNSVADKGEVARYRAQVATRKSQKTTLLFKKQQILQALRNLVPELNAGNVNVGELSLDNTVSSVLQCVAMIQSKEETPLQYTLYDDLNALLKSIKHQQTKIANSYSNPDLMLTTQFQTSAVDESTGDAFDESFSEDRKGYEVGLLLNIPFGTSDTKEQLVRAEELKANYQIKERMALLDSQHEFIKTSITYLLSAIESQGVSKRNLEIRVKDVQKKYRQGRISVTEYIIDQDNLLQTELQIVETKYLVVKTLLDYLSIFTHTPCAFNRIVL